MATADDINRLAGEMRAATAAKAPQPAYQPSASADVAIRQLCAQFHSWARRNNVPTNWRHLATRGWIVGVNESWYGSDNRRDGSSYLVVTTTGSLIGGGGQSYFRRFVGMNSFNISNVGGWNILDIKNRIAQYVATTGVQFS